MFYFVSRFRGSSIRNLKIDFKSDGGRKKKIFFVSRHLQVHRDVPRVSRRTFVEDCIVFHVSLVNYSTSRRNITRPVVANLVPSRIAARNAGPVRVFFGSSNSLERQWEKRRFEKYRASRTPLFRWAELDGGTGFEKNVHFYRRRSTKIVNKNSEMVRAGKRPCLSPLITYVAGPSGLPWS